MWQRSTLAQRVALLLRVCFFSIFPGSLAYCVAITNTLQSIFLDQIGMTPPPRWITSGVIIGLMILAGTFGRKFLISVIKVLSYPLVIILLGIALYLIPQWSLSALSLSNLSSPIDLVQIIYTAVPMLVFTFCFIAAVSTMSNIYRDTYGKDAIAKTERVIGYSTILLVVFVMFFVFSCVLALTSEQLQEAQARNVSILSYLSTTLESPLLFFLGPIIALFAISSSFIAYFLAYREGLKGVLKPIVPERVLGADEKKIDVLLGLGIFLICWVTATLNPSILDIISTFSAPFLAIIMFLLPAYAFLRVPSLRQYAGDPSNIFLWIVGLLTVSALFFGLA